MSLTIREYTEADQPAWSDYVAGQPQATIAHHIGWRQVMSRGLKHKPIYLIAEENGRLGGLFPMFLITTWWRTKLMVSIPWLDYGGALADSDQIARKLIERAGELARDNRVEFVELRSIDKLSDQLPTRSGKVTFKLTLESDPEPLWKQFDAKLRNQIRKAEKSHLTTHFGGVELLPEFYRVFAWKMHQLGTPVWGYDFFKLMFDYLPDAVELAVVRLEDTTVAAGLVLKSSEELYVPSAAAFSKYLKLCPNHALYWSVIKRGCEQNYRRFDFGRSTVDSNTYRFKKQWVREPIILDWQYLLNRTEEIPAINPDNPKYRTVISLWQKMPLFLANWLGPKVIRNFP